MIMCYSEISEEVNLLDSPSRRQRVSQPTDGRRIAFHHEALSFNHLCLFRRWLLSTSMSNSLQVSFMLIQVSETSLLNFAACILHNTSQTHIQISKGEKHTDGLIIIKAAAAVKLNALSVQNSWLEVLFFFSFLLSLSLSKSFHLIVFPYGVLSLCSRLYSSFSSLISAHQNKFKEVDWYISLESWCEDSCTW